MIVCFSRYWMPCIHWGDLLDGAPPIDLIDGEALAQKIKELRIGVEVRTKMIEEVIIDKQFFSKL